MEILKILTTFILGTVFGSFGGVLISRERDKKGIKSILFGRSKCDKCGKILSAIELVPLVSFFAQKGKCKNCGTKLSNFYRIIELIMGIVFVITYYLCPHGNIGELIARTIINRGLTLLIIVDYTKYELHLPIRIITTIIALVFSIIRNPIKEIIISTISFVIIFLLIYFLGKLIVKLKYQKKGEGFGQGDIYLAGTIGILFPFVFQINEIDFSAFNLTKLVLTFIIISSVLGIIYALIRNTISHTKIKNSKELPFIPSMIFSFWIIILLGSTFINII